MLKKLVLIALLLSLGNLAEAADPLAYVRASSQWKRQEEPAKFHPLNLLDNDPETIWCEGVLGSGESQEISFFFKLPQRIDQIVVMPSEKSSRLIRSLRFFDGVNSVQINLGQIQDKVDQMLAKPFKGSTVVVTIETVGAVNKESGLADDVICIADVLLYDRKKAFGGASPFEQLRYEKYRDQVLGRWSGDPLGASEKTLIFALDGTWQWQYKKLLGNKKAAEDGEYRFRGNRLLMRKGTQGRFADMAFKYQRVRVDTEAIDAPSGDYDRITVNRALGDEFEGSYNNAQFK